MNRRSIGLALTAIAGTAFLAAPASADQLANLCPHPENPAAEFHAGQISPIPDENGSLTSLELRWFVPGRYDPAATFTAVVSRVDGYRAHEVTFYPAPRPTGGTDLQIIDVSDGYGLPDTGRWRIRAAGCADAFFFIVARSRIVDEVPLEPVLAGSTVAVGSTVRGYLQNGFEDPVAGVLIDVDRSPNFAGSVRTHVGRVRTDSAGRVRTPITVYSNTRIYQDNVLEAASRHDPAAVQAPTILVRKRITRAVTDTTPAVGQRITVTGTVYPAKAVQPVYLQRWNGEAFVSIATGRTSASTGGRYSFSYTPAVRGSQVLRAYTPYDAWHVSSASTYLNLSIH